MRIIHGGDIYSYSKKMLDFSSNINPLGFSEAVYKAGCEGLKMSNAYPDVLCRQLRRAIADSYGLLFDDIICGNGAAELIYNIVSALKPEKILLTAPTFGEYEAASVGADISYYYLKEENGFKIQEDILNYITNETDMVFICNPNNPTGILTDKELILQIADRCRRCGAFAVVDECFMDFAENADRYSVLNEQRDNMLVLKAFTKMYAMPGMRLGWAVCHNQNIIDKMYGARQPWSVSVAAQKMGISALNEKTLPMQTRAFIKAEREYLENCLDSLGIKYFKSEVNFILLKTEIQLADELDQRGILIRKCDNYTGLGWQYYRIAVKSHKDNEILAAALSEVIG